MILLDCPDCELSTKREVSQAEQQNCVGGQENEARTISVASTRVPTIFNLTLVFLVIV